MNDLIPGPRAAAPPALAQGRACRALLVQLHPLHSATCFQLWPFLHTPMEYSHHQLIMRKFCCLTTPHKCSYMPLGVSSSISRLHPLKAVFAEACQSSGVHFESGSHPSSHCNEARGEVGGVSCHDSEPVVACSMEELKEIQRRQRIGLANKGKVPWNKGRKHSAETCARIKERTLEALRDPKVRKKMSESPRMHSEQSKRKIGSSLKKLWAERLKRKRSKETFYSSWAESIAEAARMGGIDEEQFDWDSYDRMKVEIAFQRLQWDEEKAKKKEMNKIQAERKVRKRVQNMAQVAQKKVEHKQNAKQRAKKREIMSCKTRKKKEGLAASRELNITDKLAKILEKKSIDGPSSAGAMIYLQSALEKFDIESIKAEQKRNTVSLADQIQAAKSRRMQIVSSGSTMSPRV
ncbi:uncharacterized protein LOC104891421 isoform X2 [Beta vulgaris subsp. vulgaris]|nr:uncharacterized protein LOC104891421 isoform X2 [Beta vulgaris subsp. vulgaris]